MAAKKNGVVCANGSSLKKDESGIVLTEEMRDLVIPAEMREVASDCNSFVRAPIKDVKLYSELSQGKFRNSRKQQGFDNSSMSSLANSIAKHGLIQNLMVREVQNPEKPEARIKVVIAGERRLRAIRSLVEQNEIVYNRATRRHEPATKVYATVPCLVDGECSDEEALFLNFVENDERVPLSSAETIDYFLYLEQGLNLSRKEIEAKTGKSQAWLSHLYNFEKKLDPQVYEDLRAGRITWSAAVRAMEYEAEAQPVILEHATAIAEERQQVAIQKADEQLQTASVALSQASAERRVAERQNDPRAAELARNRAERAAREVNKATETKERLASTPVTPSQSDIAEGAYNAGIEPHGNRNLTGAQIREHYVTKIDDDLLTKRFAKDPKTGNKISTRDLRLVKATAKSIAVGKRDVYQLLREFYVSEGDWGRDEVPINDVSVPPSLVAAKIGGAVMDDVEEDDDDLASTLQDDDDEDVEFDLEEEIDIDDLDV